MLFEAFERFKYILCSYLSDIGQNVLKELQYLNTSYVLIYHIETEKIIQITLFKYILCSYLSVSGCIVQQAFAI